MIADHEVAVLDLDTGEIQVLVNGTDAHYAPSGHLVFGWVFSLWVAPFDIEGLDVTEDPSPMVENVQDNVLGWSLYSLAEYMLPLIANIVLSMSQGVVLSPVTIA